MIMKLELQDYLLEPDIWYATDSQLEVKLNLERRMVDQKTSMADSYSGTTKLVYKYLYSSTQRSLVVSYL